MKTCNDIELPWYRMGEYVKAQRIRNGMSQGDLAEAIGQKQPNVSDIERGTSQPTVGTIFKLADALNINPIKLLERLVQK